MCGDFPVGCRSVSPVLTNYWASCCQLDFPAEGYEEEDTEFDNETGLLEEVDVAETEQGGESGAVASTAMIRAASSDAATAVMVTKNGRMQVVKSANGKLAISKKRKASELGNPTSKKVRFRRLCILRHNGAI